VLTLPQDIQIAVIRAHLEEHVARAVPLIQHFLHEEGDGLRQAAVNPSDKFELVFKHLLESLFVERMDQNEEIFVRFMNDAPFQKVVTAWMASEAYRRLRSSSASETLREAGGRPSEEEGMPLLKDTNSTI
jgi:hypothetical protein